MKGDAAIVTGASSGIGLAISRVLCRLGYEVFGIGRNFNTEFEAESFHKIICDILDTDRLCDTAKQIAAQNRVTLLVNNAGTAYYGLHEELNPRKISQMVRTNLEAPMILTCQLLRELKKNRGYIINISSVTAGASNPHGCAYGATKAGLSSFSRSLFDEARKYGVKVVSISPDMTRTNLYRNADFREGAEAGSYLLPEEVANAVEYVLSQREGLVVSDITLKPQLHRIMRKK
ncbi:MAG: SDR family oxidoreductase [Lachnospiraceae bacterium]|nr:SDR family oxidoreductase [Lachnospiraceae bacterium]